MIRVIRYTIAVFGTLVLSCSLLIDTSLTEGFPCEPDGRCLEGYRCEDGICVRDVEEPEPCGGECEDDPPCGGECEDDPPCGGECEDYPCGRECEENQRCDRATGECVPICEDVICPTGEACLDSEGGCAPVLGGPGELCQIDDDCAGILSGCSDGTANCACVLPATMVREGGGTQGVCLGFPEDPTSCDPCSAAECYFVEISSAGDQGLPEERAICAPVGFKVCGGEDDCSPTASEANTTVCTFLGWPEDPEMAGWPRGLFAACATPMLDSQLAPGDVCDRNDECETGLCMPMEQGSKACTTPCDGRPEGCQGVFTDCLNGRVSFGTGELLIWEIAPVCGQGPTLGMSCEQGASPEQNPCGTDAPYCVGSGTNENSTICTRVCRKNSDCGFDETFYCALQGPDYGFCLPSVD